MERLLTKMN